MKSKGVRKIISKKIISNNAEERNDLIGIVLKSEINGLMFFMHETFPISREIDFYSESFNNREFKLFIKYNDKNIELGKGSIKSNLRFDLYENPNGKMPSWEKTLKDKIKRYFESKSYEVRFV